MITFLIRAWSLWRCTCTVQPAPYILVVAEHLCVSVRSRVQECRSAGGRVSLLCHLHLHFICTRSFFNVWFSLLVQYFHLAAYSRIFLNLIYYFNNIRILFSNILIYHTHLANCFVWLWTLKYLLLEASRDFVRVETLW